MIYDLHTVEYTEFMYHTKFLQLAFFLVLHYIYTNSPLYQILAMYTIVQALKHLLLLNEELNTISSLRSLEDIDKPFAT